MIFAPLVYGYDAMESRYGCGARSAMEKNGSSPFGAHLLSMGVPLAAGARSWVSGGVAVRLGNPARSQAPMLSVPPSNDGTPYPRKEGSKSRVRFAANVVDSLGGTQGAGRILSWS